ncbi:MAG: hypothetical protein EXS64_08845 [Candidatus Latescibacteria bacterium]|nr:hypothetical protein [Candidatus Latescibacterota bacterium]
MAAPEYRISQTQLSYPYEFAPKELDAIVACNRAHGFAVVKQVISPEAVEELKASVREVVIRDGLNPGESRYCVNFLELSPAAARLLGHEKFMVIARALHGEALTFHRSAAIAKDIGAGSWTWHTDWTFPETKAASASAFLNTIEGFSSMWLYLNGTHPSRAGLAIIPDSNAMDWAGPEGFALTEGRKSFYRIGTEPKGYTGMDVPGMLPLLTDPGDLIVFADRTYHGVFPHQGTEVRLSIGMAFRPGQTSFHAPWPLPESAKKFIASVPKDVRPVVEHYTGIDLGWKLEG